jgi:hypothetical protein
MSTLSTVGLMKTNHFFKLEIENLKFCFHKDGKIILSYCYSTEMLRNIKFVIYS